MTCRIFKIAKSPLLIMLLIVWVPIGNTKAQSNGLTNEEITKVKKIFQTSRRAIGLETEKLKIQKLSVNHSVSSFTKMLIVERKEERTTQSNGEREFHTSLPRNFRYSESMNLEDTLWISKFTLTNNLLNAENYGIWEGKRYENEPVGLSKLSKEEAIRDKREEIFFILFPILLESKDFFPLDFRSAGKANVNGEKVDVLEAALSENTKIKIFFDEQTHLLKMIITNSILQNGAEREEKRFYSNYKTVDGLMIAHKIIVELKQSSKRLKSERIEEQILKSTKINPTFKPNFFEVKKK